MAHKTVKIKTLLIFTIMLFANCTADAKKYPFDIESQREVYICRSTTAGTKMVTVIAYGSSADIAIEKAMVNAVAAFTFDGVSGMGEFEGAPAILHKGREEYYENKDFFDKFFKKGEFLPFVKKVNSTFPMGEDNVKTKNGRRIRILLIVDWKKLSDYYQSVGFETILGNLSNY